MTSADAPIWLLNCSHGRLLYATHWNTIVPDPEVTNCASRTASLVTHIITETDTDDAIHVISRIVDWILEEHCNPAVMYDL